MDGRLKQIENMLSNPKVEIYTCQQLLIEFESVINRPKIQKYLKPDHVQLAREAISSFIIPFIITEKPSISRDPKDDYLLYFSEEFSLVITGDKDLLVLKNYGQTRVITFSEFVSELEK